MLKQILKQQETLIFSNAFCLVFSFISLRFVISIRQELEHIAKNFVSAELNSEFITEKAFLFSFFS